MGDVDLARRAVASPRWRWLPGMLRISGPYLSWRMSSAAECAHEDKRLAAGSDFGLPDLADPATLGAVEHGLLAPAGVWVERVQTAALRIAYIARTADGAFAAGPVPLLGHYRDSLAAALVDGLESAP